MRYVQDLLGSQARDRSIAQSTSRHDAYALLMGVYAHQHGAPPPLPFLQSRGELQYAGPISWAGVIGEVFGALSWNLLVRCDADTPE